MNYKTIVVDNIKLKVPNALKESKSVDYQEKHSFLIQNLSQRKGKIKFRNKRNLSPKLWKLNKTVWNTSPVRDENNHRESEMWNSQYKILDAGMNFKMNFNNSVIT